MAGPLLAAVGSNAPQVFSAAKSFLGDAAVKEAKSAFIGNLKDAVIDRVANKVGEVVADKTRTTLANAFGA